MTLPERTIDDIVALAVSLVVTAELAKEIADDPFPDCLKGSVLAAYLGATEAILALQSGMPRKEVRKLLLAAAQLKTEVEAPAAHEEKR